MTALARAPGGASPGPIQLEHERLRRVADSTKRLADTAHEYGLTDTLRGIANDMRRAGFLDLAERASDAAEQDHDPDYQRRMLRWTAGQLEGRLGPRLQAPAPAALAPASPGWGAPLARSGAVWPSPAIGQNFGRVKPRQFLYGRHYLRGFLSVTVAPGGVGKSSLGMVEAAAMATGRDLLGIGGVKPRRVWLINGEDPRDELDRRLESIVRHYGLAADELAGLNMDSGRDFRFVLARDQFGRLERNQIGIDFVVARIKELAIDVVIFDPLVAFHEVGENDNRAIEMVAQALNEIAERAGVAVEVVHHSRKLGGGETTTEDARGASALIAKARTSRVLNRMTKTEAEGWGLSMARSFFRVDSGDKVNVAPPAERATWYRLEGVDLDNATEEDPADNVAVVTRWTPPIYERETDPETIDAIKTAVREHGNCRESVSAADWVGRVIAEVLGMDPDDPADRKRLKLLQADLIGAGHLKRVIKPDAKREARPFVEAG